MTITEAIGFFTIVLCFSVGAVVIGIAAYTTVRRHLDLAALGLKKEQEDALLREQERLIRH